MSKTYVPLTLEEIKIICKIYGYEEVAKTMGEATVTFKARLNKNLKFTEKYKQRVIKALCLLDAPKLLQRLSNKVKKENVNPDMDVEDEK